MTELRYPLLSLSRLRMETDGAGVTTLVAGAGCPLRCKWCLNGRLLQEAKPTFVSPQELYDRVKIDNLYFQATGGGITFGGGEALLHGDFIRAFRKLCGNTWKINVQTSLQVPREQLAEDAIDCYIVDIKDMDPEIYRSYTGADVQRALENLRYLLEKIGPERITVRVPLIPEYNTETGQKASSRQLSAMGVTKVDCFSYIKR